MGEQRICTSFTIREDLKQLAEKSVKECKFPGISSLGGLIELGLVEILRTKGITLEAT